MDKCIDVNKLYEQDSKLKKDEVEMLLVWCGQQRHFPKVAELQVALALHACYYSLEQAKGCLESYFTIRGHCKDLFTVRNPDDDPALKQAMNVSLLTILPEKTNEGYYIVLGKLMNTNPDLYNPQIDSKLFDTLVLRQMHQEGPGNGLVFVMDMKGGVFGHLTKLNLGIFKKFLVYLQTAMPIRLISVHFINVVPFMDKLLAIVKPFVNKEMFQKLIVHTHNENLYKYVPLECLPSDYGGNADAIQICFEKMKENIYDNLWFSELQKTMVTDESKRIGPRKNSESLFGFDGSFKRLSVD
ncbi:alpha-tocopherol transfer protein-like [Euwallacea similis]|uniref:alpha-tocopherol transfer protein-like n=1 Tax=Euwallacea similis TaxID=1736056 RepID=UPI00344C985E